jgi:hypothetical protein
MLGVMAWLGGGVLLLTLGFRLGPSYLEFLTVRSVMNAMSEDQDLRGKSRVQVLGNLGSRLDVNGVRGLPAETFTIEQDNYGRELVADYEARVPVFFNIDAVLSFNHRATLPGQ